MTIEQDHDCPQCGFSFDCRNNDDLEALREALDYVLRNRVAISADGALVERDTPPVVGSGGWYEHELMAYVRRTLEEAVRRVQARREK